MFHKVDRGCLAILFQADCGDLLYNHTYRTAKMLTSTIECSFWFPTPPGDFALFSVSVHTSFS